MTKMRLTALAAAALVGALAADPAAAQGKGKGGEKEHGGHGAQAHGRGQGGESARPAKARGNSGSGRSGTARPATARPSTGQSRGGSAKQADRTPSASRGSGASRVSWDRDYEGRAGQAYAWDADRYRRSTQRHKDVPPGWCNGVGNPHNTVANCGVGSDRYDSRYGVYRDRDGVYRDRDNRYGTYGEAHEAFHRHQDQICSERLSQRPLDPSWQVQVRSECSAEHDRWHDRYDPNASPSLLRVRLPF